jgi:hypothetical protein
MNRKHLITVLAAIAITGMLLASSFFAQIASSVANTYGTDNMTVTGVLASDSYELYPYEAQNLLWGFSKYGELINGAAKQGLEYNGLDVFANPNVLEKDWSQGWLIDIHYADLGNNYKRAWAFALYTDTSTADGIGGDWKENSQNGQLGLPYGGRKTNVWATTDPIKVLYDGPRRFVAQTRTTLYSASDHSIANSGLVNVTLTFEFNKDKKQVIVFKDIKRLDQGKFGRSFQVEFSNRGEWDIGTTSAPPSYAYFYDDLSTVYDYHYHNYYSAAHPLTGYDMVQMIDQAGTYVGYVAFWPQLFGKMVKATNTISRTEILTSLTTVEKNQTWLTLGSSSERTIIFVSGQGWPTADPYPRGDGEALDNPLVFKNGVLQFDPADYSWNSQTDTITFVSEPADTDYITIEYKHNLPNGRDYDNMGSYSAEPGTPYVIGEWAFELTTQPTAQQFRAVSVYGLTDRHDADDYDAYHGLNTEAWSNGANVIDAEVKYYLNETFNPFDLYNAVEKKDYRWVDIRDLTAATSYIDLTTGLDDQIYYVNASTSELAGLGWTSPDWTGYYFKNTTVNATGEWVNTWEDGPSYVYSGNWAAHLNASYSLNNTGIQEEMLKITPTDFGPLGSLRFSDLVDFSFWYKTRTGTGSSTNQGPGIEIKLYNQTNGVYFATLKQFDNYNASTSWQKYTLNNIDYFLHSGYTADNAWYISDGATIAKDSDGNTITTGAGGAHSYEWWNKRLKDFYVAFVAIDMQNGDAYVDNVGIAYLDLTSGLRTQRVYNMEEDKLVPSAWNAYCSFAERVLVDGVLIDRYPYHLLRNYVEGGYAPYYVIDFVTGNLTFYHYVTGTGYTTWTLPIGTHIKILYSTIEMNEKGRYEWMVLGKNARTIDSAAAAYVSEAFDSTKDIRVEMIGMDIREFDYGPNSPYVVSGPGTATRADYVDSLGRPHLRDDWCTTWPVASSNMIFMAGPRANLGTEYMNEFTNAFFARSEYVVNNTGQANTIMGLSCWNFNNYTSGYGVISVYKDLNGTIGLVFWGYNADDYYYTCKWFWSYPAGILAPDGTVVYSGIEYLQHENRGVTDIILHITYPTLDPTHPTVTVTDERLGTISEKTQHDP